MEIMRPRRLHQGRDIKIITGLHIQAGDPDMMALNLTEVPTMVRDPIDPKGEQTSFSNGWRPPLPVRKQQRGWKISPSSEGILWLALSLEAQMDGE